MALFARRYGFAGAVLLLLAGCGSKEDSPGGGTPDGGVAVENSLITCQDGKDNDGDLQIDCADEDCKALVICNSSDGGTDGGGGVCSNCNDGLACTIDDCNTTTRACSYAIRPGTCAIEGRCYADGDKNGSQCQVCDPGKSRDSWTPIVGGCTIGSYCYRKGEKSPDGCSVCDPSRSATSWTPTPNIGCTVGGRCYEDGERDTTGCQMCKVATSTTSLSPAPFACNIGGQCFAAGDKHPTATCTSATCNPLVSTSTWTIGGDECLIGGTCYAAGDESPDGCSKCLPSQSKTSWTSSTYACRIGGMCYSEGEKHPSPTCTSVACSSFTSSSAWTVSGDECLISGYCRQRGDKTSNGCQECNPTLSKTNWSPVTGGCNISGSCYASGSKHPSASCKSVSCNVLLSTTSWTVSGSECLIGGTCYAAGEKSPDSCQECNPTLSKTSWSPSGTSCTIAGNCYANGTAHPASSCLPYSVTCNSSVSNTAWTVGGAGCAIGGQCYAAGALDPTGCSKCDPTVSKTSWTPQSTCTQILMAALNEGHQGNLGGIAGADALCAAQATAAGYSGTWKAFLSSSTQNVRDIIPSTSAAVPVVNLLGQNMYASWNAAFTSTSWSSTAPYLTAFNGKTVTSGMASPDWYDADGWHGSTSSGLVSTSYTCNDWTDSTSSYRGQNGEWDLRAMFNGELTYCSTYLAVACVRLP